MKKINLSLKQGLFILFLFSIFVYSMFQARFIIIGPYVKVTYPKNGEVVYDQAVVMTGKALNAAWISLNGRQIFVDENGEWSEKLIAPPGLSIMTVKAQDRFGRETDKSVEIVFNQS